MTTPLMRRSLVLLVALLPALSLLAPLAAAPALGLLAALVVLPWLWRQRHQPVVRSLAGDPLLWLAGALALWGLATLLWSPHPLQGATLLPRVVLVMVAGIVFTRLMAVVEAPVRAAAQAALIVGLAIAALWLVIDVLWLDYALTAWLTGNPVPENIPKRGLTLLSLLIWPAALAIGRWRRAAAPLAVALVAAIVLQTEAGAAKAAIFVGGTTFALAWLAPRLTAGVAAVVLAVGVLSAPLALAPTIDSLDLLARTEASARHRLVIWTFTAERVQERPLTGWGFNMARSMPGGQDIDPLTGGEYIPLHPHNAPLQWWLELGLPGALIGVVLLALVFRRAATIPMTRAAQATALATAMAAVFVSAVGYGAWQLWWLSSLAIISGLTAAATAPPSPPRPAESADR